ncbi:MAG: 3-hydroxybutyryl-CoA dehydrogenase [Phycisphaerales bacterium]|nr:3-hydroxybutyryl-CoA dehydrogenase [Phycisphaerales bacterium]
MNVKTVGVVGAGQMGGGIALVAALNKFNVIVCDKSVEQQHKCEADHKKRLAREVEKQRIPAADAEAASKRIRYVHVMDFIKDSDFVVEAAVENLQVKKDIFASLVKMVREDVILATNTSSISITEIAAATELVRKGSAARVIGMHFFNPVPVMKLVEVIKGLQTAEGTTATTLELAKLLGKTPIPANDRPGFVSNRVLMPLINEAFYAWMEGVAEPAHLDEIMKLGCNFPMGPLRLADFIGLDTCEHIMNVLADGLNNDRYRACPLLKQLVAAGRLGDKSGRGVFDYSQTK